MWFFRNRVIVVSLGILSILFGCVEEPKKTVEPVKQKESIKSKTFSNDGFDMSNPSVFLGSDFGNFIRSLYGIGDFERMLKFTAAATINRYGKESLLQYYQKLDMRMEMKLLNVTDEDSLFVMHYECIDKATKVIRRLPVVVENDTVKLKPSRIEEGTLFQ